MRSSAGVTLLLGDGGDAGEVAGVVDPSLTGIDQEDDHGARDVREQGSDVHRPTTRRAVSPVAESHTDNPPWNYQDEKPNEQAATSALDECL